ncbi:MAG: cell division protein ZapA [Clostridia bacterium]|nr:cell division protein ZapA [Clostridia bacterium]NCC75484.1 cell division protein ZapA [Clostridia bacterium]
MPEIVKRVNVRIAGVAYQLAATEDEAHIRKMAARADEMIRQVLLASPHLSQSMATILALVNAMDEVNKFRRQSEILQKERDSQAQQMQQLKTELDRVREQNWDMRKDQLHMQRLIAEYEKRFEQILSDASEHAAPNPDDGETGHSDNESEPIPEPEPSPLTLAGYQQSTLEDYI